MTILQFLATTVAGGFYVFLMAYAANMATVPATRFLFKKWNRPISEKKLGKNKTWVGTVAGFLAAMFVAFAENVLNAKYPIPEYLHLETLYHIPWPLL